MPSQCLLLTREAEPLRQGDVLRQAASRPLRRTFGLFVIYPAMVSQCVRLRSPNTTSLGHGAAPCVCPTETRSRSRFPGQSPLQPRRSIGKYKFKVAAGPAGPLSCSSMRLQRPVCSSCPARRTHQQPVFALAASPVVARSRPAQRPAQQAAAWPCRAIAGQYKAGLSSATWRPNPSVNRTSCGKPQAAGYLER